MKNETAITGTTQYRIGAPEAGAFQKYPESWYYVCLAKALRPGQILSLELCGQALVAFRSMDGKAAVLDRWCPHLGSSLAFGRVVGAAIECPYHHMRFDGDGVCTAYDLMARSFTVREQFGCIFVFLGDQVSFELPTFPGGLDLISAQPAHWTLACPWYMVVANGFDARHFSHTHDRHLIDVPQLERSSALSISIRYRYQIRGSGLIDRVTRVLSGSEVEFEVTGWGGNLALVKARFKNDVSYGMVVVEPRYFQAGSHPANAQVTVIVSAMRRGHGLFSRVRDRLVVAVKRFAIRRFMMEDANGLQQLDFGHTNLRRGDEMLAEYLRWVSELPANLAPSPVASHSFNGDS